MGDEPRPHLEVGRIARAHGLKGDVLVVLGSDLTGRLAPGSVLDADGRELEVVSAAPHQQRWIVRFAGVDSREAAEALRGTVLRAEAVDDPDDPDALWVHELIGARVRTTEGEEVGIVESVEANPASDLLVLDGGALVPLRFVVGSPVDGVVTIDPPDGLLDP